MSIGKVIWNGNDEIMGIVFGVSHCCNATDNASIYAEFEYGTILYGGSCGVVYNSFFGEFNPYLRAFAGGYGYLSLRLALGKLPIELSLIGKIPICTNEAHGD